MPLRWHENVNGYVVYGNPSRSKRKRVYVSAFMLGFIAETCKEWEVGGAFTHGDLSLTALQGALREMNEVVQGNNDLTTDAYFDLLEATEDLGGIIRRIQVIT